MNTTATRLLRIESEAYTADPLAVRRAAAPAANESPAPITSVNGGWVVASSQAVAAAAAKAAGKAAATTTTTVQPQIARPTLGSQAKSEFAIYGDLFAWS